MSVLFCNHIHGEERAVCFALTDFLVSCDTQCSVSLPCGAMGWSAVCDVVVSDHPYLLFQHYHI